MIVQGNPLLVDFGTWPQSLKKINGGVRIIDNNDSIDGGAIEELKSKAAES